MYKKPDYDRAVFRILPTIIAYNFSLELEEPHSKFTFKGNILNNFEDSEIVILLTYDALSTSHLSGNMLELWKEHDGLELSSAIPTLTGPVGLAINAGLPPELTGFMNTKVFVPEIGNYVDMLKGKVPGYDIPLEEAGVKLRSLMWEKPATEYFPDDYVLINLLPSDIADSKGLNSFYSEGFKTLSYSSEIDAMYAIKRILKILENKSDKAFISAYFSGLDSIAHAYGTEGPEWKETLELYYRITCLLKEIINNYRRRVSVYIISDHGLMEIKSHTELNKDALESFLEKNNIDLFAKSGRFAMIYADELDIEAFEEFFDHGVEVKETKKIIHDLWPLANKERFMLRAGKYTVLFKENFDICVDRAEGKSKNPVIAELINDLRRLRVNHGSPTEIELKAFFMAFSNIRE
ncbi:MAG: alkaline phosphatase family protein [Crenarchaeota archaeon]|nr:alkaline phosphatase family protein [Thermoproteota archaeon]